MTERWKDLPGYEGWYQVSDQGQVRSVERTTSHGRLRRQHVLKPGYDKMGYLKVDLSRNNVQQTRLIHQLVLETFVSERPEADDSQAEMQACHNNGVKNDNRLENLRWDSPSNNSIDRNRHHPDTVFRPRAILTHEEVREIKAFPRYTRGIYARYPHVTRQTIDAIRSGRNWKELD